MKNFDIFLELTVLIPCYNASKTIDRLFLSITKQRYPMKYLKIVAVNDGSTDDTLQKLNEWKNKIGSDVMTVIDQENQGISQTRNILIDSVTTKWFTFIDADDYYEKKAFYNFSKASDYESADIIVGKTYRRRNGVKINWWLSNALTSNPRKYIANNLFFIWNKVYKTSFIRDINFRFQHGNDMMEDQLFFAVIAPRIKRIGICKKYTYNFVFSKTSFSAITDYDKYEKRFQQIINNLDLSLKHSLNDRKYDQLSNYERKILSGIIYNFIMNIFLLYILYPAWYAFPNEVQKKLNYLFYNQKRQIVNDILNKYSAKIIVPYGWWKKFTYFALNLKNRYNINKYRFYTKKRDI